MDPMTMAMIASTAAQVLPALLGGGGNKKISNFDRGQKDFWKQYTQQAKQGLSGQQDVMGLLQSMLDPNSDFFKNFENQQMTQFNEQTIPRLGEQFAGLGAESGALSSSGFGQALGGAASGLQSNLAAGKSGMIMQALQQLMQQYNQQTSNVLNTRPFDLQDKGGGMGGGFGSGLDFTKLFSGFNQGSPNLGGGNKYPLTGGYDTMFRQQGVM